MTAQVINASWAKVRTHVDGFAMWTWDGGSRTFADQSAMAIDALSAMVDAP